MAVGFLNIVAASFHEGGHTMSVYTPHIAASLVLLCVHRCTGIVKLALLRIGKGQVPLSTKVILSHHDYKRTPDSSTLEKLMEDMFASGADVAKIATTAEHIQDAARVLALPKKASRKAPCHSCRLHSLCHDVTSSVTAFCKHGADLVTRDDVMLDDALWSREFR